MFSTFDICLLLYVSRLAGWLKHCNLSLSLSQSTYIKLVPTRQTVDDLACHMQMLTNS